MQHDVDAVERRAHDARVSHGPDDVRERPGPHIQTAGLVALGGQAAHERLTEMARATCDQHDHDRMIARETHYPARPMPVAVVTDSTHYLPADVLARHGVHVVSLYVKRGETLERESEIADLDAFYERLRSASDVPDDIAAVGRRLPRRLRAAARRGAGHRLDPPLRRGLGHVRLGASGARAARRARPRRPCRRARLAQRRRRPRPRRDRRGDEGAHRRGCGRGRRARHAGGGARADLVLPRHARVPAPRRPRRRRAGMGRRRAEDQADPHGRRRDQARRAGADVGQGVRADGRAPARAARRGRRRLARPAHPGARRGAAARRRRAARSSAPSRCSSARSARCSASTSARA